MEECSKMTNDDTDQIECDIVEVIEIKDEVKKRGRKKKEQPEEQKIKKKRGRKAALKYYSSSIRKQMPLKSNIINNECDILYIDVKDTLNEVGLYETNESIVYIKNNLNEIVSENANITSNELFASKNENIISNELYTELNSNIEYDLQKYNNLITGKLEDDITKFNYSFIKSLPNSVGNQESNIGSFLHDNTILEKKTENTKSLQNIKDGFKVLDDFNIWKNTTKIKCWWCCNSFTTVPIGLPISYDSKINKFKVRGIFCSFSCTVAYSDTLPDKNKIKGLIYYLYFKLTGERKTIHSAPSRYILHEFGGFLNIEDFRKLSNEHKIYQMFEYPMCIIRDYVHEIDKENIKSVNLNVFSSVSNNHILDDKDVEDAKKRVYHKKLELSNNSINTIEHFLK